MIDLTRDVRSTPVFGRDGSCRGWVRLDADRVGHANQTAFCLTIDTTRSENAHRLQQRRNVGAPCGGDAVSDDFTPETYAISLTDALGARDPIGLTSQVRFLREGFERSGNGRPALLLIVVKDGEQDAAAALIQGVLNSPVPERTAAP